MPANESKLTLTAPGISARKLVFMSLVMMAIISQTNSDVRFEVPTKAIESNTVIEL